MTLTLAPSLEERLRAEAQSRGVPAEEYARELLEEYFASLPELEGSERNRQSSSLQPLLILKGSVPHLTKDELY